MKYSADIDRKHPACFVFLVDQSESMAEQCAGAEAGRSKAEALAFGINGNLNEILIRCSKPEIRDYFHVAVIGYGASVHSEFSGFIPMSEMALRARIEIKVDPRTGAAAKSPIWLDAVADGRTPMCAALAAARSLVAEWVSEHPEDFPPIVINISDGAATDGDPAVNARLLTAVSSTDGAALLFNGHLSSVESGAIEFPSAAENLPADKYALKMFEISSVIPESMRTLAANKLGFSIKPSGRGMVFNANFQAIVTLLEIGTTMSGPVG